MTGPCRCWVPTIRSGKKNLGERDRPEMFATIRELEQLQGGSRGVHSSGLHCCVSVLFESRQIGSLCVRLFAVCSLKCLLVFLACPSPADCPTPSLFCLFLRSALHQPHGNGLLPPQLYPACSLPPFLCVCVCMQMIYRCHACMQ